MALVGGVACESFGRVWQTWLVAKLLSGYGVGSVQFLTGTYISELVPSRTRGFLLIFYSIWYVPSSCSLGYLITLPTGHIIIVGCSGEPRLIESRYGLGQLFASAALKILADKQPYNYLDLIYTEWAMLGIMLAIYIYMPESPWWCANHGHHERGRAIVARLNGGIEGYDVDFHYEIIRQTVEHEQAVAAERRGRGKKTAGGDGAKGEWWRGIWEAREVFVGVNGFRTLVAFFPAGVQQISGLAIVSLRR